MLNLPTDWSWRGSAADIAIFNAFVFPLQGFAGIAGRVSACSKLQEKAKKVFFCNYYVIKYNHRLLYKNVS